MNRLALIVVLGLAAVAAVAAGGGARAEDGAALVARPVADLKRDTPVSFDKEILPILSANCLACHNRTKAKADLVLETPTDILKGGESGPAVVAKKAEESLLLKVSAHRAEPVMPPKGNKVAAADLSAEQLGLIKLWIDQGATGSIGGASAPTVEMRAVPAGLKAIYAVAVTPDGQYAACARGSEVHVYYLPTGKLVARLTGHRDLVQSLAFSPDGMVLAAGGYRQVILWKRPRDLKQFAVTSAHAGAIHAGDVSPDGKTFATAGADGAVRIWATADGRKVKELGGHGGAVTSVKFSPDGSRIASTSADKTLRVWSAGDGTVLAQAALGAEPGAAAWVNGGKQIAVGGADGIIRVWDVPEKPGAEAKPAEAGVSGGGADPGAVAAAGVAAGAGAPGAAAADAAAVPVAGAALGTPKELKGHEGAVSALCIVPGAPTHLLSGGADGTVRRWDVGVAKVVKQVSHGAPVGGIAASPDGKRFASAGGKSVKLWDADGKALAEMKGDRYANDAVADRERDLAFAATEVAYHQGNVAALEKRRDEQVNRVKQAAAADTEADKALAEKVKAKADADAKKAAADKKKAEADAKKVEADVKAAEAEAKGATEAATKAAAELARAQPARAAAADELRLAIKSAQAAADAAAEGAEAFQSAQREHAQVGAEVASLKAAAVGAEWAARAVAFSTDGTVLAAGGGDGVVRTYSGVSGAEYETYRVHGSAVTAVGFAGADGSAGVEPIMSAGADGVYVRCVLERPWVVFSTLGTGGADSPLADRVTALDFSADGKWLATGGGVPSREGEVIVWDVEGAAPARRLDRLHSDAVLALDFSVDGKFLATAAADRFVKVSEVAGGRLVKSFEGHTGHVLGVAFSRGGRTVVSGSADNTVKVWDVVGGEQRKSIPGFEKEVTAVKFVGDGEQFVATAGDGKARLLRADGGEVRSFPGFSGFIYAAAVTRDGSRVVAGGEDGTLRAWDATSGQPVATLPPPAPAPAR